MPAAMALGISHRLGFADFSESEAGSARMNGNSCEDVPGSVISPS